MKNIFHFVVAAAPVLAILLFIVLQKQGHEEARQDVQIQQQAVEAARFDTDFAKAWGDKAAAAAQSERLAKAEKKKAETENRLAGTSRLDDQALKDLASALAEDPKTGGQK
jgi:hypothetical protein